MDGEDTNRILDQIWEANPELFMEWFKKSQGMIMNYLAKKGEKMP